MKTLSIAARAAFFCCVIPCLNADMLAKPIAKSQQPMLSHISTSTEQKIKQSTQYLKAMYYHSSGRLEEANKVYSQMFASSPSPYIYDDYLRFLSDTGQFQKVVSLIDKVEDKFKDDLDIQIIFALSLLNTDKDNEAEQRLKELQKKHPDNEHLIYYLASLQEKTNNLPKALQFINEFINQNPHKSRLFLFYFLQAKIYLKMGNPVQALVSVNKSLEILPEFDKGLLLQGMIYEKLRNLNGAIESYRKYRAINPLDPAVTQQLIQLLFAQSRFSEAISEFKKIKGQTAQDAFNLALLEFKAGDLVAAQKSVEESLKQNAHFEPAKQLKIDILVALKNYPAVLNQLGEWLAAAPANHSLVSALMALHYKFEIPAQNVVKTLSKIPSSAIKSPAIPLALGDLCMETKDYSAALTHYGKARSMVANDTEQNSQLAYQMAYVLFMDNKIGDAIPMLEKMVAEANVYPGAFNLLAHCYIQRGERLEEALVLADKAVAANPRSAAYLDTKGEVLYKQGKYQQASDVFAQAYKLKPGDATIQEHLNHAQQKK